MLDPLEAPTVSREELLASMPAAVRAVFPDFAWDVESLWRLPHPPVPVPVRAFDWLLDLPVWRWNGHRWQVSVRDVLEAPDRYAAHRDKAMAGDLAYPIHAVERGARLVILDGYHRLLKAHLTGRTSLDVVVVPPGG